jgi:hypothetical protein
MVKKEAYILFIVLIIVVVALVLISRSVQTNEFPSTAPPICNCPNIPANAITTKGPPPCECPVTIPSASTTETTTSSSTYTILYPGASPIQVISIKPSNLTLNTSLAFNVTFRNIGPNPVYYLNNCASSLLFNVSPSSLVSTQPKPVCGCLAQLSELSPNNITSIHAPSCSNGYKSIISKAGNATANFTIVYWNTMNYSNTVEIYNFSKSFRFN